MNEVSKVDWKLFRNRVPEWQERHMERLIKEYIGLLESQEDASKRFWMLEKRIRNDRNHPGVILELRKSEMVSDIVMLINEGVIEIVDIEGFSEELIDEIQARMKWE